MPDGGKTSRLVLTALMMCLIMVLTMMFKIPIPFANGYVHLGDAMIFLSVMILGWKYGAVAAAIGSALGDVLGGFPIWAPWTLVIKGAMAIIMGFTFTAFAKKSVRQTILGVPAAHFLGMLLAGIFMTAGYYAAEGVIYGNWLAPLLGAPWNVGQFVVGMAVAGTLTAALYKTPARRYFIYGAMEREI